MNPVKLFLAIIVSALLLIGSLVASCFIKGGLNCVVVGVSIIAALILGGAIGSIIEWTHEEKRMDALEFNYHKMEAYNRLLMQWLSLKQEGKNLKEYLEFNGYKCVAVYGINEVGERLLEELEDTDIEIKYVVDRNADNIVTRFPKYKPDDELPDTDVMVVAAILAFQNIQESMEKKVKFPIVSLEDLIYGLA